MRGTPVRAVFRVPPPGLIPTYAGNTWFLRHCFLSLWAHPHVCGEHHRCIDSSSPCLGSSPRMRGTRGLDGRAGGRSLRGSSPRMRGTRWQQMTSHSTRGLIPTYAGNTLADMGFYPHTPSFRISLEPKASINPTRFLGLSPSGSTPIPASFAPPFPWP